MKLRLKKNSVKFCVKLLEKSKDIKENSKLIMEKFYKKYLKKMNKII